jgi:hypothetical protein
MPTGVKIPPLLVGFIEMLFTQFAGHECIASELSEFG